MCHGNNGSYGDAVQTASRVLIDALVTAGLVGILVSADRGRVVVKLNARQATDVAAVIARSIAA
jgi:hypothetical protein